jgi:pimeloyl-ACP methyl ester carboxylesterase
MKAEARRLDAHTLEVGDQRIPYHVIHPTGRHTILFLHGFARDPRDYRPYLEALAERTGARVIAPFIFANGRLRHPPRSVWACVATTRAFCEELARRGQLESGYEVVGHSTGGLVAQCLASMQPAPSRILAMNPILPVRFGPLAFVFRAILIALRQLTGRTAPISRAIGLSLRTGGRMLVSVLSDPKSAWALMRDISQFQMEDYRYHYDATGERGKRYPQPTTVLYATGDEFFEPRRDVIPWMRLCFDTFEFITMDGVEGHEWALLHPDRAAHETAQRLQPAARHLRAA